MFTKILATIAVLLALAGPANASPLLLYAAFDFDFDLDPAKSIPLDVGLWHVGSVAGAAATAGQLHQVLSNLTNLTIGATGMGVDLSGDGLTVGGFSFTLTNPNLGGVVSNDFATGDDGWANWNIWGALGGAPGGAIGVYGFDLSPTFLSLASSAAYSGDVDAAFGQNLTFRFAAGDAGWHPPYDFSSGRVILAGDDGVSAVPEPTSLLLLGTGALGLIAMARRRKKQQAQA